jgi:hypothetical protein
MMRTVVESMDVLLGCSAVSSPRFMTTLCVLW